MKKIVLSLSALAFLNLQALSQSNTYSFGRTITIKSNQVAGTLTNFPVLVDIEDMGLSYLFGNMLSDYGYDIFFTNHDETIPLEFQIEDYDVMSGRLRAWVKVPEVTEDHDVNIRMFYGKSGITANPSDAAVWDNNYKGVWHFRNDHNDGTATGNNLNGYNVTPATGKIGTGRMLNTSPLLSNDLNLSYFEAPSGMLNGFTDLSFEGWVNVSDLTTNWERIFDFNDGTINNYIFLSPSSNATTSGTPVSAYKSGIITTTLTAPDPVTTGNWHHYAVTLNSATDVYSLYVDGELKYTSPVSYDMSAVNFNTLYFGKSAFGTQDHGLMGSVDEFRISNTARSANWIKTSYNNQNNPAAFVSLGTEYTYAQFHNIILPVGIEAFDAALTANKQVQLSWQTGTGRTGRFFVERSADAKTWNELGSLMATEARSYRYTDIQPLSGASYYRLRQQDADGTISFSAIRQVQNNQQQAGNIRLWPNPAGSSASLQFEDTDQAKQATVSLTNAMGQHIQMPGQLRGSVLHMDLSQLPAGLYLLHISQQGHTQTMKLSVAH